MRPPAIHAKLQVPDRPIPAKLSYSVRRHLIDEYQTGVAAMLPEQSLVIDLGGNKIRKRGNFNIEDFPVRVFYVNLVNDKKPDVISDVGQCGLADEVADSVIISEVLEHVPDPAKVLAEAYRILKPGGLLVATIPFMFHVHADPHDYGRYTHSWFAQALTNLGFEAIEITRQGGFFLTLAGMVKQATHELTRAGMPRFRPLRIVLKAISKFLQKSAKGWDLAVDRLGVYAKGNSIFSGSTTGYGITCRRPAKP